MPDVRDDAFKPSAFCPIEREMKLVSAFERFDPRDEHIIGFIEARDRMVFGEAFWNGDGALAGELFENGEQFEIADNAEEGGVDGFKACGSQKNLATNDMRRMDDDPFGI